MTNYYYLKLKLFFYTNYKLFNFAAIMLALNEEDFLRQLEQLVLDEPNLLVHSVEKKSVYSYELKFKHYSRVQHFHANLQLKLVDFIYCPYPGLKEARNELLDAVKSSGLTETSSKNKLHFILSLNLNKLEQDDKINK